MKLPLLLIIAGLTLNASGNPDQPPANPNASPAARAVLKFVQGLQAGPEKRLLSGQFDDGIARKLANMTRLFGRQR